MNESYIVLKLTRIEYLDKVSKGERRTQSNSYLTCETGGIVTPLMALGNFRRGPAMAREKYKFKFGYVEFKVLWDLYEVIRRLFWN